MSKNTKAKKSGKSIGIIIAAVLCAIIVIALAVFNNLNGSGWALRNKVAAKSDNFKVTGSMYAYYLGSTYQNFYQYLSYLGADPNKSMKTQDCPMIDGTWFDYFVQTTDSNVRQMLASCEYAKANGLSLDAEDKAIIQENIDALNEYAKKSGVSVNQYLNAVFGNGVQEADVKKAMEISLLSTKGSNKMVTSEEITLEKEQAYCNANPDEFLGVDYYSYSVPLAATTENEDEADIGESLGIALGLKNATDGKAFMELVQKYLESKGDDIDAGTVANTVNNTYHRHALKESVSNEEVQNFLFEEGAEGTTYVVTDTEKATQTVYLLEKKAYVDETVDRAVRHILFSTDDYEDDAKAQEVYAELKAADFSEDKWNELAAEYSSDDGSNTNGGLYKAIQYGQTVTAFNDWLFDDARKAGDTDIVESTYGWHIMQYVGEADTQAWMKVAEEGIKNDLYAKYVEEYGKSVTSDSKVVDSISVN